MASRRQFGRQPEAFSSQVWKLHSRVIAEGEVHYPQGLKSYYKESGVNLADPIITRTERQLAGTRARGYLSQQSVVNARNRSDTNRHAAALVVGTAAAAYGGYQAYQHRAEIKEKAHLAGDHLSSAFHSTRAALGA